jgi:hypothetical protein
LLLMTVLNAPQRERRLVLRILARWREICGDRPFPRRDEMTEALIGDDWRYCLGLVLDDRSNPRFDHIGSALDVPGWAWSSSTRLADCPDDTLLKAATCFFPRVLDREVPICIGDTTRHIDHPIMFRAILLPLSSDGERIDALFGAANWRTILADLA